MKRKCLWKEMNRNEGFPSPGRVTWRLDFPFCQCSIIIVSVSKTIPKDWIAAEQLIWAPFLLELESPPGICGWSCTSLVVPWLHFSPFQAWGWERAYRWFFFFLLCLCPRGSLNSVYLSQCWERQWYRHSVYFCLWSFKLETGILILKGQKRFSSLVSFSSVSFVFPFYFTKYPSPS